MSTLSSIQTRLSIELGDSETVNKTAQQRTQAINEALRQVYEYRNWPNLYLNKTIQGVDGVFTIPRNMDKPSIIWYGENTDYYWELDFINQTDFFTKYPYSITKTEVNGVQVLELADDQNRGHAEHNYTGTSSIGINDVVANSQVGQTFIADGSILYGVLLKLRTQGSPTGTLTVDIKATVGGLPTGSSLATTTININELTSAYTYQWSKFDDSFEPTEGDTYSVTVTPSYSTDPVNYVQWAYSTTSQITGSQVLFDGVWTLGTGDQVFVLCNNFYKFQYTTKFIDLTSPTEETGMPLEFDQAIAKMAAGIILMTKGKIDQAALVFYGIGGNQVNPSMNSAFGLLNLLWTRMSEEATRTKRRIKTIFERRGQYRRRYDNYYNPSI